MQEGYQLVQTIKSCGEDILGTGTGHNKDNLCDCGITHRAVRRKRVTPAAEKSLGPKTTPRPTAGFAQKNMQILQDSVPQHSLGPVESVAPGSADKGGGATLRGKERKTSGHSWRQRVRGKGQLSSCPSSGRRG